MALGLDCVLRRARGAGFSVSPAGFAGELLCVGAVLMRVSLAMGEQPVRPAGSAVATSSALTGAAWIACRVPRAGVFLIFRGKTRQNSEQKKDTPE
ncbi:MAG TPA: hypothetical protein VNN06_10045 [Ramlibacter sp.]|nr:hypothetical protein [Ramlibacter sp.]